MLFGSPFTTQPPSGARAVRSTNAATAAASEAPKTETPTRRRGRRRAALRGSRMPVSAGILVRTVAAAASTDWAKPAPARGLALRRAPRLSDVLMTLLRESVTRSQPPDGAARQTCGEARHATPRMRRGSGGERGGAVPA